MIIPFSPSQARSQVRAQARAASASMSASEQRAVLEQLLVQLRDAGPHGLTPELQSTLKCLGCANEHEVLLKVLGLLLDRREQVPAGTRCSGEIAYSSLY